MDDVIQTTYRILKTLEASMDFDEFDQRSISAETLHVSERRRLEILQMLLERGFIKGISIEQDAAGNFLVSEGRPRLTLDGVLFMNENTSMQRAMKMAKGIKDSIPGL